MLQQLKISNFRLFDDEVTMRFRPITVLIGRNNAGKSSVIKFLLMLQQSLGDSAAFLVTNGEKVRLGRYFNDLKNAASGKTLMEFSLEVQKSDSPGHDLAVYFESKDINPHQSNGHHEVSARVLYSKSFQGEDCSLKFFVEGNEILSRTMLISDDSRFLKFPDEQSHVVDDIEKHKESLAVQYCRQAVAQHIEAIRHISPVKTNTPGAIDVGDKKVRAGYVGKYGKHTLHHLWEQFHKEKDQYQFIRPHLESIIDIEKIEFDEKGDLAACNAWNKKTGSCVNIADFGFGVSQCLPILVQGAMMNPNTTLVVEQPEAQVHPTAQLELGSFLADLYNKRKVRSIIETHSNNILLRLRKLVAEGTLESEDITVAFFDIKDGKATIENLDINKDGTMEDGLPMEFFGADIIEGLELGKAKFERSDDDNEQTG